MIPNDYECEGQFSLFDTQEEPKPIPNYATEGIFEDGYREIREYDKPMVGIFDDLTAKHGIMVDFKILRQPYQKETLQMPCYRMCDVEWCSLACFLRRGYIRHDGKWVRNDKGEILISKNKECDWTPKEKSKEPIYEIEIKGYCNDPYCTHCNYRLDGDEYKERCPSCGCLLDWKRLKEFEERERKWDSE
jgi:hypothetical protein